MLHLGSPPKGSRLSPCCFSDRRNLATGQSWTCTKLSSRVTVRWLLPAHSEVPELQDDSIQCTWPLALQWPPAALPHRVCPEPGAPAPDQVTPHPAISPSSQLFNTFPRLGTTLQLHRPVLKKIEEMQVILKSVLDARRTALSRGGPVRSYVDALIQQGQVWARAGCLHGPVSPPQGT